MYWKSVTFWSIVSCASSIPLARGKMANIRDKLIRRIPPSSPCGSGRLMRIADASQDGKSQSCLMQDAWRSDPDRAPSVPDFPRFLVKVTRFFFACKALTDFGHAFGRYGTCLAVT